MGRLEKTNRRKTRKSTIQRAVLLTLASMGRVGPDLLIKGAIDHLLDTDLSTTSSHRKQIIRSAANRLRSGGLVKFENNHYVLTKTGSKILNDWEMSRYEIKRPRRWDQKWRVIIFDIPEKMKRVRDQVRNILSATGFQRLQDSVWVYPYDCEDVIGLMKIDLGIGKYLLYMIVDEIENDRFLRMDFDLLS